MHVRIRPSELGSHTSMGSARLNASSIWVNSACVMSPSLTALRLQQRLVESRPDRLRLFHTAPVDPPSNREYSRISRCLWQTHLSILGTAPPARRFCRTMHGIVKPPPWSIRKLSICRAAICRPPHPARRPSTTKNKKQQNNNVHYKQQTTLSNNVKLVGQQCLRARRRSHARSHARHRSSTPWAAACACSIAFTSRRRTDQDVRGVRECAQRSNFGSVDTWL